MRKPLKLQLRLNHKTKINHIQSKCERLASCAIIRDGITHHGRRSHAEIRRGLGDADAYDQKYRPNDTEGFMTSIGRFVTRQEAKIVGEAAGQCRPTVRELLSSDITW
jgi:hypothetical protein